MVKKQITTIFLLVILFGSLHLGSLPTQEELEGSQVPPSFLPTPVSASEEESVDTMTVNPANRYTVVDTGWTDTIDGPYLNLTDTGDGTSDTYSIERELSSLDDRASVKFKYSIDSDSSALEDNIQIYMYTSAISTVRLLMSNLHASGNGTTTTIGYFDTGGTERTKTLTNTGDNLVADTWYILEFDFDLLRSEFKITLKFGDNKSKVWDYTWQEINDDYTPKIFDQDYGLVYKIYFLSNTNNRVFKHYIDWIDAPWKENEWRQVDTPTDPQYLQDSWHFGYAEYSIDDQSQWRLTVPYLDSISGSLVMTPDDPNVDAGNPVFSFTVYGVDGDDGDLHQLTQIQLAIGYSVSPWDSVNLRDGAGGIVDSDSSNIVPTLPRATFSVAMQEERSRIDVKVRAWKDYSASNTYWDMAYSEPISTYVTDPSSEFVIEFNFDMDIHASNEIVMLVEDFAFQKQDIFADLVTPVVMGVIDFIIGIFLNFFIPIILFLAGIFKWVGDFLLAGFTALIDIVLAFIEDPLGFIGDILTFLGGLVVAMWEYLEIIIGDAIDWFIAAGLLVLGDIIGFGADLIFWLWDAIGLPNVLVWLQAAIDTGTSFLGMLTDTITFFIAIVSILGPLMLIVHFAFPLAMGRNIEGFMAAWFDVAGFDITFGLLEGYLPRVPLIVISMLIWIPWLVVTPYYEFW